MPEVCSPAVRPRGGQSRAGLRLEACCPKAEDADAEVVLVDQQGLQFVPRVQAMSLGRTVRFTNADSGAAQRSRCDSRL